jgi:hypothetical protein
MKKLISTFLFSFLLVGMLSAQVWNISDSTFNALEDTIKANLTIDGLTINASNEQFVIVDANDKTVGDLVFTHRLKLGGAGTYTDGVPSARVISFNVDGNSKVSVAAMSSSGGEDRVLIAVNAAGDTLAQIPALGASLALVEFEYTGDSTTIYMFSSASGINIYYLKAEAVEEEEPIEEPIVGKSTDEYAIFDPAAVNEDLLPEGMKIVEINGKKWLQVVVDGWNSILNVPEFVFEPGMTAFTEFRYVVAQTEYTASQINACVQVMDTVNKMTVSWSADPVTTTTGLTQSNPSGKFVRVKANAAATSKFAHQVQFFGQQTSSWGAVAGDTLWVGKVRAYKVDDKCIFDPVTYDPADLVDGMSVVEVDGKKMLQVIVNGWNSTLNVPEFNVDGKTAFANFKYTVGQTEFAAAQINAAVQLIDTVNKTTVSWSTDPVNFTAGIVQSNPSGKFAMSSAKIPAGMKLAHQVQFFGQQTSSWGAVVGDTLWVGKVRAYVADPNVIFDPATYDPADLVDGMKIIDADGKKLLQVVVNGWNSTLNVPAFNVDGKSAFANFKYTVGQTQFTASQINAAVQLIDTVNKTTVSWSTTPVNFTTGIVQSNPSGQFVKSSAKVATGMKLAHQVQFFGQETSSWGAVAGDTLWVGKVLSYKVDPDVVFDPATYDAAELPKDMSIVDIDGVKYLKAKLDGWKSAISLYPVDVPATAKFFTCKAKYEVKSSGFELAKINTFLKLATSDYATEIAASGQASSATFVDYSVAIAKAGKAGAFQFAGQETTGWSAVAGDNFWVGKVTLVHAAPITFVVDDSKLATSTGFALKGSWKKATGVYDSSWDGGIELAKFYDDGTHGDKTAGDHIWSVTVDLIVDKGANTWKWGINDSKGNWCLVGPDREFSIPDAKAQTQTYENVTSSKDFAVKSARIYPNPATNMITVMGSEIQSVEIYNIVGSKVLVSTDSQVDISALSKGTYIAKVFTVNGEISMSKFNKE